MKNPFHLLSYWVNSMLIAKHYILFFFFLSGFICFFSQLNGQVIATAAGTVTWTVNGTTNITEVTLNRNGPNHGDGFDGAMSVNVTGTNVTFTNSYHFSSTYGVGIQHVAITNNGGTASTFTLNSTGNLGSDGSTRWHYSSASGPRYTISSDNITATANGSDPIISLIYGNAALNSFTTSMPFTNNNDAASFSVSNVPISAGQTRRFLILVGVGNIDDNISNAASEALVAVQNLSTGAWPADFTSFLTPTQKSQVINWSSLTTLPVSWRDFTAQLYNSSVKLNWSTATELNTKDFVVQHSVDSRTWSDISTLNAAGSSTIERTYSFIHTQPSYGANYYRIKQNDIDGKSSYSKTVKIIIDNIKEPWKIYQNPVAGGVLEIQLRQSGVVSLYNSDGKLVFRQQLSQGYQQLNTGNQAKGLYYLKANGLTKTVAIQ